MDSIMDLGQIFVAALQLVVPQPCYGTFFSDFDFTNATCLKIVISKSLGFAIILGSVLVKVPQIIKIYKARTGEGINLLSVILEIVAVSATLSYSYANDFPFSSYGESLFMILQTASIAFLVLAYDGKLTHAVLFLTAYVVGMAYLLSPSVSIKLLNLLQTSTIAIVVLSKAIQISENFRNGSTGQLSAITVFLLFAGSIARIFTSIQETGDKLTVITYVVATSLNAIMEGQMIYYWNVQSQAQKTNKKKQ